MEPKKKFERIDEAMIHIPDADISFVRRKFLDIPYADLSPAQKLDIYLPDSGNGPFPLLLQVHGGAFAIGDKRDIHLEAFLKGIDHGYAVVSVNYRLSGEAVFPAGLQDLKASLRWLRANQASYLLDGKRIAACGGSTGGNYTAMLGVTGNTREFDDARLGNDQFPSDVQAVVDWFGPIDFLKMDEQLAENGLGPGDHSQPDSPESRYLGAPIEKIPELVKKASPANYIHTDVPPIFIQHGRMDNLVPVQQSILFYEALQKVVAQDRLQFEILEGAGHGDPLFETDGNMEKVFAFLDRVLK
jgi:acetyl esterase/lipase